MTVTTRLLPDDASSTRLRRQWTAIPAEAPSRELPVALLRTIVEDPFGGNHLRGLDAAFDDHSDLIDDAWADAQLAADTTWLGLGIGVRVAVIPEAGRFQVVLIEIRARRQIAVGGCSRSPLLALRRARRRLVSAVDARGPVRGRSGSRLRLVGGEPATKTPNQLLTEDVACSDPATLAEHDAGDHSSRLRRSRRA